jgi:acetamidase/formamidase
MSETDLPKSYTVTGPFIVAGVHPGDTVTAERLAAERADVGQLIEAGHIAEVASEAKTPAKKASG